MRCSQDKISNMNDNPQRDERARVDEFIESELAVKDALADMDAGDTGQPFDEFMCELRQRRGIDSDPC